jgi:5'(3')-deoxyribonucleotidase
MQILIDLDGVVTDFVKGAAKLFQLEHDELLKQWIPGCYEMEKTLGISTSKFFGKIEEAGEDFWANLEPFEYGIELFEFCQKLAPTCFLSSPTLHPSCLSGKLKWMKKHFGSNFREYVLTPRKEKCARHDSLLVDDYVNNVDKFRQHGGNAILWPMITNPRHQEAHNCFEIGKQEIVEIHNKIKGLQHA